MSTYEAIRRTDRAAVELEKSRPDLSFSERWLAARQAEERACTTRSPQADTEREPGS